MSDQQPPGPTPPEEQQQPPSPYQPAPSPYQPAPPSRMSPGLVIGLIVALVLVAGALVFGAFLIASDGDEPPAAQESASSSEGTQADPESEPPDAPGDAISGEGYSYPLPDGWQEATDEVLAQNPPGNIDTVSVLGDTFATARSNVLVEVGPTGGESDVTVLQPAWEGNIASGGADPIAIDATEIAGEAAVGVRTERVNAAGTNVSQIAYLVIHEDNQFSIAISYPEDETEFEDVLEQMLADWSWE